MPDLIGIYGTALKNHWPVLLLDFSYGNFITSKKEYLINCTNNAF
jgi:hypothetical protein